MKIFYDKETENIVFENDDRLFSKGSLIAVADGDNIEVLYKGTGSNSFYLVFSDIQKEDGSQAGSNVSDVVDYLNIEFNIGKRIEGEDSFVGLSPTVNVTDNNLVDGDVIYIVPTVSVVNEIYFPTIVQNNSFTVNRIVINALNGLTVNLPFKWRKLR